MDTTTSATDNNRVWHHLPDLPVQLSPLFQWPLRPVAILKWFATNWQPLSAYVIWLAVAAVVYFAFQPSEIEIQTFSAGWIFQIWLRNILIMTLTAGSLHLYFYTFSKQKKNLKYEQRDLDRNSKTHDFGNQIHDNMFWTLVSGVAIWTAYEVLYFWASANHFVPRASFAGNPVWFVLLFPLIALWSSFHFYWIHRLLHWPPLYKVAHKLHHRNVNVGPWSGISMHPIEHILYFSSLAIHFVVASHPVHFLFHAYFQGAGPAMTHCGFEGLEVNGKNRLSLGTFFHQLHHKFFKCNYGNIEMPWDRWFGSFHDGTNEATRRIRKRQW